MLPSADVCRNPDAGVWSKASLPTKGRMAG